ncbi:endonuclease/exonuclease/phosphatase family protein [Vibrio maritimus]|uniref:Endonuclease/exonuclease/phosphatase family protein n=1 Tax=Vibrio maritimus TaxID=990268 RepID=A0A090SYU5_9VIBR|nr:endonuclease/exonuclease/phosphatase family protein [Vibrio maritimus]
MENIYSEKQWHQKTNWLKSTLRELNSDIIAFQEVFSIEALRALTAELGYEFFEYNQLPAIEADYIYSKPSLAVASRFPISKQANLALCEPFSGEFSRPPLHVSLSIQGLGDFDLFNVHLKSKRAIIDGEDLSDNVTEWLKELAGSTLSSQLRQQEALSLHAQIVGHKREVKRPFILLGDFNNVLTADEFAPFRAQQRHRRRDSRAAIAPYHFHDSWKLIPHGIPVRAQDAIKSPRSHYYGESGQRIDHILVSSEFVPEYEYSMYELIEYQLTDKHIVNPTFDVDDVGSDHALVSITFESRH